MLDENTKQELEILKQARAKINAGWIQGTYANDAEGKGVSPLSDSACKFCTIGAVINSLGDDHPFRLGNVLDHMRSHLVGGVGFKGNIVPFNDLPGRTKEEVLELFDKVIARLEYND